MKINTKFVLVFFLFFAMAAHGVSLTKTTTLLEEFEFQGQKYSISAYFLPPRAGLTLKGQTSENLSAGLDGENIHLGTRISSDNFYVFWLNYRESTIRLALYDHRCNRSRLLPLAGFSFIGLPEIIEENKSLQGLVFLGNRSKNDDIFYYETEKDLLTPLTETPFSEKGFHMLEKDGELEIATSSLWAKYRYRFDRLQRKVTALEEQHFHPQKMQNQTTFSIEHFNTYLGFGDSITWGQIEGQQHLELCYLTQMRTILATTYGPAYPINLGIPGGQTYDGTLRIEQNLNDNPSQYFLLMLGVNDVWRNSFSLESSLENLEFIVTAALAHGRRVIVSTLTPRKDEVSYYKFYWQNLRDLSAGILDMAKEKKVASIDTLTTFMNTNPPDGWKALLENIIPNISKGNHPNAEGHRIIATLFADALVAFPPQTPQNILILNSADYLKKNVQWDMNYESDFSHFVIEFAFEPNPLSQRLTTVNNYFTFTLFPFLPQLYFRLQAVDRGNHASAFSPVFVAQTGNFSRAKLRLGGANNQPR